MEDFDLRFRTELRGEIQRLLLVNHDRHELAARTASIRKFDAPTSAFVGPNDDFVRRVITDGHGVIPREGILRCSANSLPEPVSGQTYLEILFYPRFRPPDGPFMRRALCVEVTNIGKMKYLSVRVVFSRLALDLTPGMPVKADIFWERINCPLVMLDLQAQASVLSGSNANS
jgi:hypothetical protein